MPDVKELRTVATEEQVKDVILQYVQRRPQVLASLVPQLREMRAEMEKCAVFMSHSFIRTSLLFKYSNGTNETSVHMIDLKGAAPAGRTLTHRAANEAGNGEDGYLTGVDNLIRILEACEATPAAEGRRRGFIPWGGRVELFSYTGLNAKNVHTHTRNVPATRRTLVARPRSAPPEPHNIHGYTCCVTVVANDLNCGTLSSGGRVLSARQRTISCQASAGSVLNSRARRAARRELQNFWQP